jgi:hypothetical protein
MLREPPDLDDLAATAERAAALATVLAGLEDGSLVGLPPVARDTLRGLLTQEVAEALAGLARELVTLAGATPAPAARVVPMRPRR